MRAGRGADRRDRARMRPAGSLSAADSPRRLCRRTVHAARRAGSGAGPHRGGQSADQCHCDARHRGRAGGGRCQHRALAQRQDRSAHSMACRSPSRTISRCAACAPPGAAASLPIACRTRTNCRSRSLRDGGAVILGKTNCPEFTLQGYTDNLVFGVTRNPWNLELTPGGSSGGAVAAVAAGLGPVAVGTDGGGSIRRPAAHTGLVGFKPSRDAVARADGFPVILLDCEVIGPIARTVADTRALFHALAGTSAPAPVPRARCAFSMSDNLAARRSTARSPPASPPPRRSRGPRP